MKQHTEKTEVIYFLLRDALRKLRGNNQFRGSETYLMHQNELRIPFENRGSGLTHWAYVLHLTPETDALWAERLPDHALRKVSDFEGDWQAWLLAIVAECRGDAYLHTQSDAAPYRKALIGKQPDSSEDGL
jgi:hypothetical protein